MKKVVIVGGGPAGRLVVHMLHNSKQNFDITLIKDEHINVNRCAVPYGIVDKKPVDKYCISNNLVTDFGAKLVIDYVENINTKENFIETMSKEVFNYDYLLLATGSKPFIPNINGVDLDKILTVRSKADMENLRNYAKNSQKVVVVGGGYIGVEVAVILKKLGLEVFIVEMLPHILLATMDDDFAITIEEHIKNNGIEIINNSKVVEFAGKNGVVREVVLEDGKRLESDFVVLSVGVTPNVELAEKSGILTSKYGIITNEYLKTNVSNIFASGDCAEKKSFVTKKPTKGEFGTNAVFMSKVVASNIMGKNKIFPGVINANASTAFEYSFGSAGLIEKMAKDENINVVVGESEVLSMYPMMDDADKIKTKLVFDKSNGKLIGGSVLRKGHCTANNVDFISLAIQMGATIEDILTYQYATHPELAAKPSDNTYMFAAKDALSKI